jgi:hypothetical protein
MRSETTIFTTFCIPLLNLHLVYYFVFELRFSTIGKSPGAGAIVTSCNHSSGQPPDARAAVHTFVVKNTQKIARKAEEGPVSSPANTARGEHPRRETMAT